MGTTEPPTLHGRRACSPERCTQSSQPWVPRRYPSLLPFPGPGAPAPTCHPPEQVGGTAPRPLSTREGGSSESPTGSLAHGSHGAPWQLRGLCPGEASPAAAPPAPPVPRPLPIGAHEPPPFARCCPARSLGDGPLTLLHSSRPPHGACLVASHPADEGGGQVAPDHACVPARVPCPAVPTLPAVRSPAPPWPLASVSGGPWKGSLKGGALRAWNDPIPKPAPPPPPQSAFPEPES